MEPSRETSKLATEILDEILAKRSGLKISLLRAALPDVSVLFEHRIRELLPDLEVPVDAIPSLREHSVTEFCRDTLASSL
jgi:hypothetical protein